MRKLLLIALAFGLCLNASAMSELDIKWKDEHNLSYALIADNLHEIHPMENCESEPFIVWKDADEIYIKAESAIKIINSGTHKVFDSGSIDVAVNVSTNLDTGSIAVGSDYYVYLVDEGDGTASVIISANSTYPDGETADNSRKIGGFHTLCANVGTISGHTLTGVTAGSILPASVWDITHRPVASPEGMVYSDKLDLWVDIYLASGTGSLTASVNGGTISDTRNWMDFVDDFAAVKKRMLTDIEFQIAAAGSNEETNIALSVDPVTTGGHSDTAGRRMISNIGCEDMCGAMYQWLNEQSYKEPATPEWGWYDLPGSKGSLYNYGGAIGDADVKLIAGGGWSSGASCGSCCRSADYYRWIAGTRFGGRGCSELLK